jgi:hypothetical protein
MVLTEEMAKKYGISGEEKAYLTTWPNGSQFVFTQTQLHSDGFVEVKRKRKESRAKPKKRAAAGAVAVQVVE